MDIIDLVLDSDLATNWQAMRDRTEASPAVTAAERARVPCAASDAEILACQGSDARAGAPVWLLALNTLLLLGATGVDRAESGVDFAMSSLEAGF